MLSLHRFQQDLICQTFISGSPFALLGGGYDGQTDVEF